MTRKFLEWSFFSTKNFFTISKIFTNGKRQEDTFQSVHYLVCISNVEIIESRGESFVWSKQLLGHSKPEFCVLLTMNWTYLILGMFTSNFMTTECTMFRANRISKIIFLVSLVVDIFVIPVIFASWLKRIAAWCELWTVKSIDCWLLNFQRNLKY